MAHDSAVALSPAELAYIYSSLSQEPPIRPDGRSPTHFRPLTAETDILPATNGSARVCFADGTEAVVGIKAEVEKRKGGHEGIYVAGDDHGVAATRTIDDAEHASWLNVTVDVPGMRDDDALPVFLAAMIAEALLADEEWTMRLSINSRFYWKLHVDILLLTEPHSYPLPLLSLATHLALLSTKLPTLVSEGDEDPLFDDDWEAARPLFPRAATGAAQSRPPIILLIMAAGDTILFDPSREELAVADAVVAISAVQTAAGSLEIAAIRTVDLPSRLTVAGVPNSVSQHASSEPTKSTIGPQEAHSRRQVWHPPRGGMRRTLVSEMVNAVLSVGGVGQEVMDALSKVGS